MNKFRVPKMISPVFPNNFSLVSNSPFNKSVESKLNFKTFGLNGGIIFFYTKAMKFTFLNQGWIIIAAIPP